VVVADWIPAEFGGRNAPGAAAVTRPSTRTSAARGGRDLMFNPQGVGHHLRFCLISVGTPEKANSVGWRVPDSAGPRMTALLWE